MKTKQLVIYRNFKHQQLFDDMAALLAGEPAQNDSFVCANQLIELASTYGFEGNLWHCFLAFCMANHENAYSTACEIVGEVQGSLNDLAMQDFKILKPVSYTHLDVYKRQF